jgi:hypothetical protein
VNKTYSRIFSKILKQPDFSEKVNCNETLVFSTSYKQTTRVFGSESVILKGVYAKKPNGQNHAHLLSDNNGIITNRNSETSQISILPSCFGIFILTHLLKKTSP